MVKDPEQLLQELNKKEEKAQKEEISPTKAFSIDVVDDLGKRWVGDFVYRVPTLGEQITIGRLKAEYLPSGAMSDPNALGLVEVVCYLQVTLRKKPDWWKPMELYDSTPLMAVYAEAMQHEATFHGRARLLPGISGLVQEPEGGDQTERAADGDSGLVRQVQSPTERRAVTLSNTERSA